MVSFPYLQTHLYLLPVQGEIPNLPLCSLFKKVLTNLKLAPSLKCVYLTQSMKHHINNTANFPSTLVYVGISVFVDEFLRTQENYSLKHYQICQYLIITLHMVYTQVKLKQLDCKMIDLQMASGTSICNVHSQDFRGAI